MRAARQEQGVVKRQEGDPWNEPPKVRLAHGGERNLEKNKRKKKSRARSEWPDAGLIRCIRHRAQPGAEDDADLLGGAAEHFSQEAGGFKNLVEVSHGYA